MKRIAISIVIALVLVASILLAAEVRASGGMGSTNFSIPWSVVTSGSGQMASANFKMEGTVAQGITGPTSSEGYRLRSGYWAGIWGHLAPGDKPTIYLPAILRRYQQANE